MMKRAVELVGANFQRCARISAVQIAAHIQPGEFVYAQQPILHDVHHLVKDELRRQRIVEDHDVVEGDGRHGGEVRQAGESKFFQFAVKRRIGYALLPGLQDANALQV